MKNKKINLYHQVKWKSFSLLCLGAAAALTYATFELDIKSSPFLSSAASPVIEKRMQTLPSPKVKKEKANGILVGNTLVADEKVYLDFEVKKGEKFVKFPLASASILHESESEVRNKLFISIDMPKTSIAWKNSELYLQDMEPGKYRMALQVYAKTKNIKGEDFLFEKGVFAVTGGCSKMSTGCVLIGSAPQYIGAPESRAEIVDYLKEAGATGLRTMPKVLLFTAMAAFLLNITGFATVNRVLRTVGVNAPLRARKISI